MLRRMPVPSTIDIHDHYVPRNLMARVLEQPPEDESVVTSGEDRLHFDPEGITTTRPLPRELVDLDSACRGWTRRGSGSRC